MHLAQLVDYIHLNPVQTRIATLDQLGRFRWSSFRQFTSQEVDRPAWLVCEAWLQAKGELIDTTSVVQLRLLG